MSRGWSLRPPFATGSLEPGAGKGGPRSPPGDRRYRQHSRRGGALAGEAGRGYGAGEVCRSPPALRRRHWPSRCRKPELVLLPKNAPGSIDITARRPGGVVTFGPGSLVLIGSGFVDPEDSEGLISFCAADRTTQSRWSARLLAYCLTRTRRDGAPHGRAVLINHKELAITLDCARTTWTRTHSGLPSEVALSLHLVVELVGGFEKHVSRPRRVVLGYRGWRPRPRVPIGGRPGRPRQRPARPGRRAARRRPSGAATCTPGPERLAASVGVVGYLARELPGQVPAVLGEL